jgi:ribonuclease P protein component
MSRLASLSGNEQFTTVFRRGRAFSGSVVVVRVVLNGLDRSRLGLVVGKKVGGAVQRNRAKRRIRQFVNSRALVSGWDVVVIARTGMDSAEYRDIERELEQLFGRAGLLVACGHRLDGCNPRLPENGV